MCPFAPDSFSDNTASHLLHFYFITWFYLCKVIPYFYFFILWLDSFHFHFHDLIFHTINIVWGKIHWSVLSLFLHKVHHFQTLKYMLLSYFWGPPICFSGSRIVPLIVPPMQYQYAYIITQSSNTEIVAIAFVKRNIGILVSPNICFLAVYIFGLTIQVWAK